MRDAEVAALVRDVLADLARADARLAEAVQLDRVPVVAQLGGGEDGDGAAEAVADRDDLVGRVGVGGLLDGVEHAVAGLGPGGVEAAEGVAAVADVGRGHDGEVEVGQVVADGAGAAEGDDDEVVGAVGGDEAGDVGDEGAVLVVSLG